MSVLSVGDARRIDPFDGLLSPHLERVLLLAVEAAIAQDEAPGGGRHLVDHLERHAAAGRDDAVLEERPGQPRQRLRVHPDLLLAGEELQLLAGLELDPVPGLARERQLQYQEALARLGARLLQRRGGPGGLHRDEERLPVLEGEEAARRPGLGRLARRTRGERQPERRLAGEIDRQPQRPVPLVHGESERPPRGREGDELQLPPERARRRGLARDRVAVLGVVQRGPILEDEADQVLLRLPAELELDHREPLPGRSRHRPELLHLLEPERAQVHDLVPDRTELRALRRRRAAVQRQPDVAVGGVEEHELQAPDLLRDLEDEGALQDGAELRDRDLLDGEGPRRLRLRRGDLDRRPPVHDEEEVVGDRRHDVRRGRHHVVALLVPLWRSAAAEAQGASPHRPVLALLGVLQGLLERDDVLPGGLHAHQHLALAGRGPAERARDGEAADGEVDGLVPAAGPGRVLPRLEPRAGVCGAGAQRQQGGGGGEKVSSIHGQSPAWHGGHRFSVPGRPLVDRRRE